jgi:hypothetical protein
MSTLKPMKQARVSVILGRNPVKIAASDALKPMRFEAREFPAKLPVSPQKPEMLKERDCQALSIKPLAGGADL